jgi:hypothetical protein
MLITVSKAAVILSLSLAVSAEVGFAENKPSPYFLSAKTSNSNIELLFQDYDGNKIGYDHVKGKKVNEISDASYSIDNHDEGGVYREIKISPPKKCEYSLDIYANKDTYYSIYLSCWNEVVGYSSGYIYGIINKDEAQTVTILHTGEKNRFFKTVDLKLIQQELNYIKGEKLFDKSLMSGWEKYLKDLVKLSKKNEAEKIKPLLSEFIGNLNTEKASLEPEFDDPLLKDIDKMIRINEKSFSNKELLKMLKNRVVQENYLPKPLEMIGKFIDRANFSDQKKLVNIAFEIKNNLYLVRTNTTFNAVNKLMAESKDKPEVVLRSIKSMIVVDSVKYKKIPQRPGMEVFVDELLGVHDNLAEALDTKQKLEKIKFSLSEMKEKLESNKYRALKILSADSQSLLDKQNKL